MATDRLATESGRLGTTDPARSLLGTLHEAPRLDPSHSVAEVVDLLCDDQRRCWRRGESPSAESYLGLHPALREDLEARLEIVFGEISLREERGEAPEIEEYLARFPELHEALGLLFRVHRAIAEGVTTEVPSVGELVPTETLDGSTSTEIPARVGGYEIIDVLGRGGMGVVYRAFQPSTGRLVALKMILAGPHAPANAARRFRVEIEAIARLTHPNVVPIYDAGVQDGRPYLVMEYVPGTSLAERIAKGPLQAAEAARMTEVLARAVHAMHQRGVIHRDLKSANILLTADGVPKIADFGLARLLDCDESGTATGDLLGTPQYMAPEQAGVARNPIGPAVDVYSLGAIFYEELTGRPPFQAPTLIEVVRLLSTTEPVPPTRLVPGLARDLETIVLTCLRKDPSRRYPSAEALADDIRRHLEGEPIQARPVGRLERAGIWTRKNPVLSALIGITAALIVLVVAGSIESARYFSRQSHDLSQALQQTENARAAESRAHAEKARLSATVKEERDRYRRHLYLAEMNLASQAWRVPTGAGRVAELLGHWDHPTASNDPRGWEWDYLFGAVHEAKAVIEGLSQAVWSPDGSRLAGRHGDAIQIRDRDGRPLLRLATEGDTPFSPCWSPDGTRVAAITHSGVATIWDATTGTQLWSIQAHPGRGFCLVWSPVDDRIATAGGAPTEVKFWDPPATVPTLTVPFNVTTSIERHGMLSWSPDANRLALADPMGSFRVHDSRTGANLLTIPTDGRQGIAVAFSPDGDRLACLKEGNRIGIHDSRTGGVLKTLEGKGDRVECLAWSRDGNRLATGDRDHSVIVWDFETGRPMLVYRGHTEPVTHVAWGTGPSSLVSSNQYDETRLWEMSGTGRDLTLVGHQGFVSAVAWHKEGQLLATAGWDGTVRIWDAATGAERCALVSGSKLVRTIAWSPDGDHLAVGGGNASDDRGVEIWDVRERRRLHRFESDDWANWLSWSADGTRLVGAWGVLGTWDSSTGKPLLTFSTDRTIPFAALSPDGTNVVLLGSNLLEIHNASDGSIVRQIPHAARLHRLNFVAGWSHDGHRLAVVGNDGASFVVRVIEADSGITRATLRGHTGPIHALSWSPDGARIASAGHGGEIKVWDPESGAETLCLPGHSDEVWAVAWSPDGTRLATAGVNRLVYIRDASRGQARRTREDRRSVEPTAK
ncbi:MAG: protein kinase [Isosphaeraceae bacterium]